MAVFTRTNGNAQNVVSVGNIALSTEATSISLPISTGIGKPIQGFSMNANVAFTTALGTGEAVEAILRKVGDLATVEMYQVEGDTTGQISVGVYPAGAWTASSLQTAVRAMGTTVGNNTVDVSGSDVTDGGFKLA